MFKLERLNVVKIVSTKEQRDKLINKGFVEVKKEVKKVVKKDEVKEEKPKGKVAK